MHMPSEGEPGPDSFSKGKVSSSSRWEGRYEKFFVPREAVTPGKNVISAQVHQSDAGSSDLIIDFELVALLEDEARRESLPDLFTTSRGDAADPVPGKEIYLDDIEVVRNIAMKGKRLISEGKAVSGRKLMRQMENNRQFPVFGLPMGDMQEMSPAETYRKCAPSVLIISPVSKDSDPNRPGEGWGSGFVITKGGIAVTNWHVIEAMKDAGIVTATTYDGRVFPITKILAARKKEDVAVIQVDTGEQELPPLPLAFGEGVGEPVTIISHPRTNFFNLTRGYISRYFKSRANGARLVSVTADIAGGSSGSPILNRRGEVIGVVSMTESLAANPLQRRSSTSDEADDSDDDHEADGSEENAAEDSESAAESEKPEKNGEESEKEENQESQQGEESDQKEEDDEQQGGNNRPRTRIIPTAHQMTMKYGAPAISVLELLE